MPLVPYVEDVNAIMDHVLNGRKGPIKPSKTKPTEPPPPVQIKLVSPVQQTTNMALSTLKKAKKKRRKNPWV